MSLVASLFFILGLIGFVASLVLPGVNALSAITSQLLMVIGALLRIGNLQQQVLQRSTPTPTQE